MQQQAIIIICQKLGIEQNIKEIKNAEIVAYRNDFSAHSPNRGRGKSKHSFIQDRYVIKEGKVKGYTANHETGFVFREENINYLISRWDKILEKQLELISSKILKSKT